MNVCFYFFLVTECMRTYILDLNKTFKGSAHWNNLTGWTANCREKENGADRVAPCGRKNSTMTRLKMYFYFLIYLVFSMRCGLPNVTLTPSGRFKVCTSVKKTKTKREHLPTTPVYLRADREAYYSPQKRHKWRKHGNNWALGCDRWPTSWIWPKNKPKP